MKTKEIKVLIAGVLVGIFLAFGYTYEQTQNARISRIEQFIIAVTQGQ
jgi:predicted negative regulator of RcsB-dependent stress response